MSVSGEGSVVSPGYKPRRLAHRALVSVFRRQVDERWRVPLDTGTKHDAVDHREDSDVESQAESEREDDCERKPRLPSNRAQSVPEILTHTRNDRGSAL